MELKKHIFPLKSVKLRTVFLQYLCLTCVATLLLAGLLISIFFMLFERDMILRADYSARQLDIKSAQITSCDTVTPEVIPEFCDYAVYMNEGIYKSGSLDFSTASHIWEITQEQGSLHYQDKFFKSINREDEICVIRYDFHERFADPVIQRYLPYPLTLAFYLFVIGLILEIFLLSCMFGKKLEHKMSSVKEATTKIQEQNIDFSIRSSGITEIDSLLSSIDQMRAALKESLDKQWTMEQSRRDQISALAHDIKTPLTVIRGNTDLLVETPQTPEQQICTGYIFSAAEQIDEYLLSLLDISIAESGFVLLRQEIVTEAFITELDRHARALASTKKLVFHIEKKCLPVCFSGDPSLLMRAIMNLVTNGVEYSSEKGELSICITASEQVLSFCVVDSGHGFSSAEKAHAVDQFYMGDHSRSSKGHYGIGLFAATSIAKQHGGGLRLENSLQTGGGMATFYVAI